MADSRKASVGLPTHSKQTSASEVGRAIRGWAKCWKSQDCSNWNAVLWHLICSYSQDGKKSVRLNHAATPEFVLETHTLLKYTPFVSWDVRKITGGTTPAFSVCIIYSGPPHDVNISGKVPPLSHPLRWPLLPGQQWHHSPYHHMSSLSFKGELMCLTPVNPWHGALESECPLIYPFNECQLNSACQCAHAH